LWGCVLNESYHVVGFGVNGFESSDSAKKCLWLRLIYSGTFVLDYILSLLTYS
jgi:hypothetical protein